MPWGKKLQIIFWGAILMFIGWIACGDWLHRTFDK